jgi:hypothetical protein
MNTFSGRLFTKAKKFVMKSSIRRVVFATASEARASVRLRAGYIQRGSLVTQAFCLRLLRAARALPALLVTCFALSAPWQAAAESCQVFSDPLATAPVVTAQDVIGTYRRLPVQNSYHTGSLALAPGAGDRLVWTNAANVSWALTPDLVNQRLLTGADNPYQNSGTPDFTLAFQGNEVTGFRFNNELYERDGAIADSYDVATSELTINRISVGGKRYCRVVVTLGDVLSVGAAPPQGNEASFNSASGQITLPVVRAGGVLHYNMVVTMRSLLDYSVLPSFNESTYHGYASVGVQDAPPEFRHGISLYTSIQRVAGYQIKGLQFGWGTWLMPDNRRTTFSLCPPGTVMQRFAPTRWWDVFQTIEGGPGQWRSTRIPSSQSKWRANSTPNCYNDEMSSPGYGFVGGIAGPDALGLAQLSNQLVIPPDGWTFDLGDQSSSLFGYGYLAVPIVPGNGLSGAQAVGAQNWMLLVNSSNFKGPVALYTAKAYTSINALDGRIAGRGLDAMPAITPSLALEINTVPGFTATGSDGVTYRRIAPMAFPVTDPASRRATLTQDFTAYSKRALWNTFSAAMTGVSLPAQLDGTGAHRVGLNPTGLNSNMADLDEPVLANTFVTSTVSSNANGGTAFSLQWGEARDAGTLPEYFRRDASGWTPILASQVPASTNLAQQHFPALQASAWPTLDTTGNSAWTSTKWAAGPFTTRLNDGSTVTYVWYRFVDQPAIARLGLNPTKLLNLQALVERMHRQYGTNGPTMAPPSAGSLVGIDPGMLVKPPPGKEVGYVPIAIGQR